jgi:hypothetical protein
MSRDLELYCQKTCAQRGLQLYINLPVKTVTNLPTGKVNIITS